MSRSPNLVMTLCQCLRNINKPEIQTFQFHFVVMLPPKTQIQRETIETQKLEISSSCPADNMHSIAAQAPIGGRSTICYQTETREYFRTREIDQRTGGEHEEIA